jgi:signal transduction histidine kinase
VAEEAGIALKVAIEAGLKISGNRELIGQTIANLLDNALKYGAPAPVAALIAHGEEQSRANGAPPSPHAEATLAVRRVGDEIEIAVADHGPGIALADRSRVLGRFVRLEGARSRPGSGLGLSLTAAVARLHGGALRLEDNAPGLRVVLSLPALPAALWENAVARLEPPR